VQSAAIVQTKLIVTDCDGVLTDNRLYFGSHDVLTAFHTRDGVAFGLLRLAGIRTAVLSGRNSNATARRASELGVDTILLGRQDKADAICEIQQTHGVDPEATVYAGDDLLDLAVLPHVGCFMAPVDSHPYVKSKAHVILKAAGGAGAFREVAERVLQAQGFDFEHMTSLMNNSGHAREIRQ
jgi:3-deoxy-D-manno-octulosonate 8-phosphate phosphatase (KDO 8-P phosphatase)